MKDTKACPHIPKRQVKARAEACEECGETMSLRVCSTCGHVGCCDSSPGRHARKHAEETGHEVMKSYPAEDPHAFTWCYACNDYLSEENE